MKRIAKLLILSLVCVCCAVGFTACEEKKDDITPDTAHTHEYTEIVIEPTCTEKGYTTYTCECGDSYIDNYTDKLQHEFTDYVSDNNATYEQDGTKTAHCNHGCGATNTITDVGTKLQSGIAFKTLTVSGNNAYGKIPNDEISFSFINEVIVHGNVTFEVSKDMYGSQTYLTKTVPLETGDNVFYVFMIEDSSVLCTYTVTLRRRPIYTVLFNTNGGTSVASQNIEEDDFATEPTTMRTGYIFEGWDYDFDNAITGNTAITASWSANTNTKYKVEYYLENLDDDNYTLDKTENITGTTDTTATAEIKIYEHFTPTKDSVTGNINGDGTTVLKVYYTRNKYSVKITADTGVTLNNRFDGKYKYGYIIPQITATFNNYLGYEWQGWYSDGEFLTNNYILPAFIVDKHINYFAKSIKNEMANFNFTSTETACTITGIKNKTVTEIVVPDYVTAINQGAFSGCSSLQEMTIPFVGGSIKKASDTYQYPFGYIFGTSSYTGGTETTQYYYGSSTSSTTNTTYYIPTSLKSVTVTGGNILYGAFYGCSSLMSITIPDRETCSWGITKTNQKTINKSEIIASSF